MHARDDAYGPALPAYAAAPCCVYIGGGLVNVDVILGTHTIRWLLHYLCAARGPVALRVRARGTAGARRGGRRGAHSVRKLHSVP